MHMNKKFLQNNLDKNQTGANLSEGQNLSYLTKYRYGIMKSR